jgi:hypothetical protein
MPQHVDVCVRESGEGYTTEIVDSVELHQRLFPTAHPYVVIEAKE